MPQLPDPVALPAQNCPSQRQAASWEDWWHGLFDVRTEILETFNAMQRAFASLQAGLLG
ncbi:MAG: hypothetical protein PHX87_05360 [Candidatus Peribacteraceae bacterium]|nr:hypothetical protein [Candidatus Peribacteraceae bacterium]